MSCARLNHSIINESCIYDNCLLRTVESNHSNNHDHEKKNQYSLFVIVIQYGIRESRIIM